MLTENQRRYLDKIPAEMTVKITPYDPRTLEIAEGIIEQIENAGIVHPVLFVGAAALGISGQGDLDLHILCSTAEQSNLASKIEKIFGARVSKISIYKWQFDRNGHEVELYLSDPTTDSMKEQIAIFEILKKDTPLKQEYEKLKATADGKPLREYMSRKYEFFNRVLNDRNKTRT